MAGFGRRAGVLAALLLAPVAVFLATRGLAPATPNPPGSFSFAVLGDAPYYSWEGIQYRLVLQELEAGDLSWVVHVGDIFWYPCSDELYRRSLDWFNGLRHPVIYTPGDNEWRDCWERGAGGFEPRGRLARIRQLFFADPTRSLGGKRIPLASQAGREPFGEFVENVRWSYQAIVFATVHLVGTLADTAPAMERARAVADAKRRSDAAAAWVRETFAEARASDAAAVVVAFHVNPSFEEAVHDRHLQVMEPFMTALEEEVERFARPVLAAHGDEHEYIVDRPLVRRTTGRRLENFTRLQVPGSPEVGWVRVVVTPGAAVPFAFEEHVVPPWKYW